MAICPSIAESLLGIFPSQHRDAVIQVYNRIPGSLLRYLQKEDIVEVININDTFLAEGDLGTEKTKAWTKFQMELRSSFASKLNAYKVKGIKAEELSELVSTEYKKKCPNWAKRGETLSAIVQLHATFTDSNRRYIRAYIYAYITERCEDNWIMTNKYRYSYDVSLDLKGVAINEARALEFGQIVAADVPGAITFIESKHKLTLEAFTQH